MSNKEEPNKVDNKGNTGEDTPKEKEKEGGTDGVEDNTTPTISSEGNASKDKEAPASEENSSYSSGTVPPSVNNSMTDQEDPAHASKTDHSQIGSEYSVSSEVTSSSFVKAPPPSISSPTTSISTSETDPMLMHIPKQHQQQEISDSRSQNINDTTSAAATETSSLATSLANSKEYRKFQNQLQSLRRNNKFILKECKDSKRLLDLKYQRLTKKINYIQISVIFLSTLSGFMQGTKEHFETPPTAVTVTGITISTYISLVLSIAKYYKFDENKEKITNLREKYAALHNKLEYRQDVLGPWMNKSLWEHQDHQEKYKEWSEIVISMDNEYKEIIATKQLLCTEFEIIMDSTSRNKYNIKNKKLEYNNRSNLFGALKNEYALEKQIQKVPELLTFTNSIRLPDDELDNWDEDDVDV